MEVDNICRLWQSVLIQAIIDANKTKDFTFFNIKSRAFINICDLAFINPIWLLNRVNKLKNKNYFLETSTKSKNFLDIRIRRKKNIDK
jgi:hypothetical protein